MKFISGAAILCGLVAVSLAIAQYFPPPPAPSAPSYIPSTPSESSSKIYPPPAPPAGSYATPPPRAAGAYPTPTLDPKLKDFPVDLDLSDFASRNQFPNDHCFFRVKGRKDIVEFIPNQLGGIFNFPTGNCILDEEKCYLARRKGRLPGMKKTDPPIYAGGMIESAYRGFAVIPYKYADDIDFSQCVPSWTGYFEPDDYKVHFYKPPKRDYSKQSCYHPSFAWELDPKKRDFIFCDAEKCAFDEKQYCDNKTGRCYLNGYPLKTKQGKSVTTYEHYSSINWGFCTDENGALIPEDGGPPYEERFQPGCSYRITAPNYHEEQYKGMINFLIHCDENRCTNQELNFDMKRKEYLLSKNWDSEVYTKTPPLREFSTIDWQCLDAMKVPDYNKELLCFLVSSDEKNPDCRLCYENKKFAYKGCRAPYDEMGRRADVPEELRKFHIMKEIEIMIAAVDILKEDYEISWELHEWFHGFYRMMGGLSGSIDELERHRMAQIIAQFNGQRDAKKLKRQILPFLNANFKKDIEIGIQRNREQMCSVCSSASEESRIKEPLYREACTVCKK